MPSLGQINQLKVIEKVADGFYLDGGELDEIFLPAWELPKGTYVQSADAKEINEGDTLDVFLYPDAKDAVCATLAKPKAVVGECALLNVLSIGKFGAFLDWGLSKDLLLPHSEQAYPVEEGRSYVVYVFQDERSGRVAATTKLHFHLEESSGPYRAGDQVELLIAAKTELGYKAVINNAYLGLIYESDLSQPLNFGDRMKGWIKDVRDDGKVDLSINALDQDSRDELEQSVLDKLVRHNGQLNLSDKSPPQEIFKVFRVSKKNFKRAISGLYKKRLIAIEPQSISLTVDASTIKESANVKTARPKKYKKETSGSATADNKGATKRAPKRALKSGAKTKDAPRKILSLSSTKNKKDTKKAKEHPNAHIYKKRT